MLKPALDALPLFEAAGVSVELISARFAKPLDADRIADSVKKTGRILVAEDGCTAGGFGGAVVEALTERGVSFVSCLCGFPDAPVGAGSRAETLEQYGLSKEGLFRSAQTLLSGGARAFLTPARAGGAGEEVI
jgi:1-deoxy-D-xylulose-5-phosphate synthase